MHAGFEMVQLKGDGQEYAACSTDTYRGGTIYIYNNTSYISFCMPPFSSLHADVCLHMNVYSYTYNYIDVFLNYCDRCMKLLSFSSEWLSDHEDRFKQHSIWPYKMSTNLIRNMHIKARTHTHHNAHEHSKPSSLSYWYSGRTQTLYSLTNTHTYTSACIHTQICTHTQ